MTCPVCQSENRATAKFCNECGAALGAARSPSCGAGHRPGQKFCDECGTSLATPPTGGTEPDSAAATAGATPEMRLASVLFVDLVD